MLTTSNWSNFKSYFVPPSVARPHTYWGQSKIKILKIWAAKADLAEDKSLYLSHPLAIDKHKHDLWSRPAKSLRTKAWPKLNARPSKQVNAWCRVCCCCFLVSSCAGFISTSCGQAFGCRFQPRCSSASSLQCSKFTRRIHGPRSLQCS